MTTLFAFARNDYFSRRCLLICCILSCYQCTSLQGTYPKSSCSYIKKNPNLLTPLHLYHIPHNPPPSCRCLIRSQIQFIRPNHQPRLWYDKLVVIPLSRSGSRSVQTWIGRDWCSMVLQRISIQHNLQGRTRTTYRRPGPRKACNGKAENCRRTTTRQSCNAKKHRPGPFCALPKAPVFS